MAKGGQMLQRAQALRERLIEIRRAIHRQPELGFQEFKTAQLVTDTLTELGIRVEAGVGLTGVVGHLGEGEPTIALRADMDALPIQELNDVPYASQVPGVMHACGHDAHVACLLGAAMLLAETELKGQVRFIFQPSEEGQDEEGKSGAMRMVEDGAMEGVDAVVALHTHADTLAGTIGLLPGPMLAAADTFRAVILGRACHGAYPHKGTDAIVLAAQVIMTIQTILSRRVRPLDSGVVTVGTIQGGTKTNIVTDKVELTGTIRSFQPEVRQQIFDELERACGVARTLGGDYELRINPGYPPTANDEALTEFVRQVGIDLLGLDKVSKAQAEMGAEDFSFLAACAPGCFFRLGAGFPGQEPRRGHNPHFDVNEDALPVGAAVLAEVARRYLEQKT
jgi:IAA-amino acid hydrolase